MSFDGWKMTYISLWMGKAVVELLIVLFGTFIAMIGIEIYLSYEYWKRRIMKFIKKEKE